MIEGRAGWLSEIDSSTVAASRTVARPKGSAGRSLRRSSADAARAST